MFSRLMALLSRMSVNNRNNNVDLSPVVSAGDFSWLLTTDVVHQAD
jgi:hypothetical protein